MTLLQDDDIFITVTRHSHTPGMRYEASLHEVTGLNQSSVGICADTPERAEELLRERHDCSQANRVERRWFKALAPVTAEDRAEKAIC